MSAYGHISSMCTLKSAKNSTEIMLVSFIIPSYNSAHTVKRCLDSIYALSLKQEEFEVIFVDDCSTDNTCEIVETYSQPLPEGKGVNNLTLFKQPKNNRQGAARNRGVSVAKESTFVLLIVMMRLRKVSYLLSVWQKNLKRI